MHDKLSFVTLTYSDENVPFDSVGNQTLVKRDAQLWLKRLRKTFYPRRIRYYLCGEYGSKTLRPHYHCILFGLDPSELDSEWLIYGGKSGSAFQRHQSSLLFRTWNLGLVHVGECNRHSIQYVAGYVTKKITSSKKTDSRQQEFSLMSRKPAIGAFAVDSIAKTIEGREEQFKRQLRIDGKTWPVGRYLLDRLRERLDLPDTLDEYITELRGSYLTFKRKSLVPSDLAWLDYLVSSDDQRYKQLDARDKLFNKHNHGEL